jgi:hypothetical protein
MAEMQRLIDKYPNGFEALEEQASAGAVGSPLPTPELSQAKPSGDLQAGVEAKEAN